MAKIKGHIVQLESDLYAPIKKYFKEEGYTVFAEVACMGRGVDMVAVKGDEHIAIELKMSFNSDVCWQARQAILHFDKSFVAFPVKEARFFHQPDYFWKQRETVQQMYNNLEAIGIGMLQVLPSGMVYTELEAKQQEPYRKLDLQHYIESDDDLGGLPYQKGVSEGYHELESIKKYVREHPKANWREIFDNVSTHYSSHNSLSGSMSQWRGFCLSEFKKSLLNDTRTN